MINSNLTSIKNMRTPSLLLVLFICRFVPSAPATSSSSGTFEDENDTASLHLTVTSPVVGILAQPSNTLYEFRHDNNSSQYIAASYVKWLEVGGARSIPIPYDAPPELLDDIFTQINGLLLPGGAAKLPPTVTYLLDRIMEQNLQGNYFPVWGTCLGFEFLVAHVGGESAVQSGFNSENISLALESIQVKELYRDSDTFLTVSTRNVTMNNHENGIEPNHFLSNAWLPLVWDITSINHDKSGRAFVSTMEPVDPDHFPFYGVQYHPEKNAFEFGTYPGTNIPYEAIDHSDEGVAFSSYMARFFVQLTRQSQRDNPLHSYTKSDLYPVTEIYPVQAGLAFEQIYYTPPASHWIHNTNLSATARGTGNFFLRTMKDFANTLVAHPDQYHVLRATAQGRRQ